MTGDLKIQERAVLDVGYGIRCTAQQRPNKVAIGEASRKLTYRVLSDRINRISSGIRDALGPSKGNRVILIAPNCIEYPELAIGIAQAGNVVVTLNPSLTIQELLDEPLWNIG